MFNTIAIAAVSTVATFAATAPATAADFTPRSVTVHYADLNLANAAGQDMLDARIRRAAVSVCGASSQQLSVAMATNTCRTAATADAQARMALVVAMNDGSLRGGTMQVVAR